MFQECNFRPSTLRVVFPSSLSTQRWQRSTGPQPQYLNATVANVTVPYLSQRLFLFSNLWAIRALPPETHWKWCESIQSLHIITYPVDLQHQAAHPKLVAQTKGLWWCLNRGKKSIKSWGFWSGKTPWPAHRQGNKALMRHYWGIMVVDDPLISLGGGGAGGAPFPWLSCGGFKEFPFNETVQNWSISLSAFLLTLATPTLSFRNASCWIPSACTNQH